MGFPGEALERHLRAWNDSVIKLNHVVHHGALGHHVQNWTAARIALVIGRIAAVDCASRIGMFLGGTMAEGWACYATDLMDECGFLTAEERVSEQQSRVRMLARALVDLEFHTGARSFEDSVALYRDEVGMPAGGGARRSGQELDVSRHRAHVLAGDVADPRAAGVRARTSRRCVSRARVSRHLSLVWRDSRGARRAADDGRRSGVSARSTAPRAPCRFI